MQHNKIKKPRRPIRFQPTRLNNKQRLHALLRQDPTLTPESLASLVGCTTAFARIWYKNFFGVPPVSQYPYKQQMQPSQ